MALDEQGGPNWANNFVDSPIIVSRVTDEFYKQPMFYAMGHFSKYIPEDSTAIESDVVNNPLQIIATAVIRPDEMRTVVILNR